MQINCAQEALFVAAEMERHAVQVYERALCLLREQRREKEPLFLRIRETLADERRHLQQFESLYTGLDGPLERQLTLSAIADGLLFEGGLMAAVRQGLLQDVQSMIQFATQEEEHAAAGYRSFASQCDDPQAKAALEGIAKEEDRHLAELREQRG